MKKNILNIFIYIILMLCSIGCKIKEKSGEMKDITYYELNMKIQNKDTFILQFSKTECPYCIALEEKEKKYLLENDEIIYRFLIDIDTNNEDYVNNRKFFSETFPDLESVPTVYKVDEGVPLKIIPSLK